ncbi:uncharacterized protein LOC121380676 [Gigantopelta aegis]|uniref:uncharacterized protein LOC121380676 n=1 Tax=Gigantopelta aegis TaxID=1735272 RepID=UPI001B889D6E|nr:uncharacterized protein LOC121380676 [Gigantopelta aegis]
MSNITDLDKVIKEWAWTWYTKTSSRIFRLNYEEADLEVVWDKVKDTQGITETYDVTPAEAESKVLFTSTYKNDTEEEHEHTFKTERDTVCTCSTQVSKGFTKSFGLEIALAVPNKVLEATAKFGKEIHVNATDQKTKEERLMWSVDTKVKAPARKHTIAQLEVNEEKYKTKFKTTVRLQGDVVVNIRRAKDRKLEKTIENDIATILRDTRRKIPVDVQIKDKYVLWPVSGEMQFTYGVSQNVRVKTGQQGEDGNPELGLYPQMSRSQSNRVLYGI